MRYRTALGLRRCPIWLVGAIALAGSRPAVSAQPQASAAQDTAVRRIVMRDARSATRFVEQLKMIQATGVFGGSATATPQKPAFGDLAFLTGGNYVLIAGEKDRLDKYIGDIGLLA